MSQTSMVLDASVTLAWLLGRTDAQESLLARHLLEVAHDSQSTVPPIWHLEIANGMLRAERSHLVSQDQLASFNRILSRLPIVRDLSAAAFRIASVCQLARSHALTAYDASYLELALRSGRHLATFDRKLADAARACGVSVWGQPHGVAEPMVRYG
ncbi:tRNA(fMet)-specific endonuclease VapC [compost metagenome]|uniref:type II toxin-antitoxin system VapC family toxin n=1 Tax=Achromobacter sp. Root83 TaxID=1736602 RepID=UPI000708C689|nr:type II toxin-antitoxin system VapC family toxin [Achromobacter sp. Root83]KRC73371.1 DNA-binding protein [Achromobacter sp. Root83]